MNQTVGLVAGLGCQLSKITEIDFNIKFGDHARSNSRQLRIIYKSKSWYTY